MYHRKDHSIEFMPKELNKDWNLKSITTIFNLTFSLRQVTNIKNLATPRSKRATVRAHNGNEESAELSFLVLATTILPYYSGNRTTYDFRLG